MAICETFLATKRTTQLFITDWIGRKFKFNIRNGFSLLQVAIFIVRLNGQKLITGTLVLNTIH
jgi:hypothetical protein